MSSLRGETSAAAVNAVYDVFMIIILQAFDCKGVMLQVNLDIFFGRNLSPSLLCKLHYIFIAAAPICSLFKMSNRL